MPLEFQTALPPHAFGITVQETPPLPQNSKMPPVVWYGYFLESPIKRLTKEVYKLFNVTLKLRLVDLNYNFECDWLIELSDNNLAKLASELVENRSLLNQSKSRKL